MGQIVCVHQDLNPELLRDNRTLQPVTKETFDILWLAVNCCLPVLDTETAHLL